VVAPSPSVLATISACALLGIEAFPIAVEVALAAGLPGYHVVGMPAASIKEGAVRIRAALEQVGRGMPRRKVTVNLAPADRRKEGAAFDLPIALGIMAADGAFSLSELRDLMVLGELGLDGSLRPIRGALSAAILAHRMGLRGLVVPLASAAEAAEVEGLEIYAADHLRELTEPLCAGQGMTRYQRRGDSLQPPTHGADMAEVRGQEGARAALEIAVAGGHNVLMLGPPGIGKTMLARRIPSILPPLSREEALETTRVHSTVKKGQPGLVRKRPFRAPHHSISTAALVGGGNPVHAGEVSLAHNGVLFLDELPEFRRLALEALRQPLEDREVTISRAHGSVTLPASFLLVASANPCPCGWLGSRERVCTDGIGSIERYRGRMSGPLMDRIDLQVRVANVSLDALRDDRPAESSASIRARVVEARERQRHRLAEHGVRTNAELSPAAMRATCVLTDGAEQALRRLHAVRKLSGRSVDRLIKVARTIADLDRRDVVDRSDILEAGSYRLLDTEISSLGGTSFVAQVRPAGPSDTESTDS